jgi:predicted amidohydrolase YtcJ
LLSRDLHAAWGNQAALRRAGIDRHTPDPPGGFILRDLKGEPSGYLLENAIGLVEKVVPPPTKEHLKAGYQALARLGYTACAGMAADPGPALAWSEELSRDGELPLRVFFSLGREDFRGVQPGWRGEDLEVAAVKFFADSALGSRTAWSLEPYPDGSFGTPVDPPELIREEGEAALRAGYTLAVHAIGSRATASVAAIFAELAPLALRPLRLEHAQHLSDATIRTLSGLPVVASLQPVHLEADQELLRALPAHFSRTAFRLASLLRAGIAIALGSDAPVAQAVVRSGLAMACAQPVLPAESLSSEQALYAYTTGGAVAAGWRDYGRSELGARADLTLC